MWGAGVLVGVRWCVGAGGRACLVGGVGVRAGGDSCAGGSGAYCGRGEEARGGALAGAGHAPGDGAALAEDAIAAIQGELVLARAHDDPACFGRTLDRLAARMGIEGFC